MIETEFDVIIKAYELGMRRQQEISANVRINDQLPPPPTDELMQLRDLISMREVIASLEA